MPASDALEKIDEEIKSLVERRDEVMSQLKTAKTPKDVVKLSNQLTSVANRMIKLNNNKKKIETIARVR